MSRPRSGSRSHSVSQSGARSINLKSPRRTSVVSSTTDHRAKALRAAAGLSLEAGSSADSNIPPARTQANPTAVGTSVPSHSSPSPRRRTNLTQLALPVSPTKARPTPSPNDEPSPQFSNDVLDRFLIQLHEGVSRQGFLPYHDYITPFSQYPGLDLASYFWLLAGPSAKGHNISWSWRYLAGCILRLEDRGWHGNSVVKFTKQDRSEWRKVTKFVNRIVTRLAPKFGTLAFVMLDTMASELLSTQFSHARSDASPANGSICHQLRKMARRHAESQAELIAMKIDAMRLPHIEFETHSMQILRILETLTGERCVIRHVERYKQPTESHCSRETISAKVGLPDIASVQRSPPVPSSSISPADIQRQHWRDGDRPSLPLLPTMCLDNHDHCMTEQMHDSPMWTGDINPSVSHSLVSRPSFTWVSNSFEWHEWTHVDDPDGSVEENNSTP